MNPLTDRITERDGITYVAPGQANRLPVASWRHTREVFDRWAEHFRTAMRNFPRETCFECPDGLSVHTFVRVLRDTRQANALYRYDEPLLALMSADPVASWVIAHEPGTNKVWFRAPGAKGRPEGVSETAVLHGRSIAMDRIRPTPTAEQIHALCRLLSEQWLDGPFQFRSRLDASLVLALETQYNVGFAYDEALDVTTII